MRAVRVHAFGGPEKLRVEDVPSPHPVAGQVLVEMRAAGVNPVDTYIRSGVHAVKPPLPYTPGNDGAGVVAEVGDGVQGLSPGDRVYVAGSLTGAYAERALCTPGQVHPLPVPATFAQGAAVGTPYITAYRALFQLAAARPGETVLVHGASGGVGIAAVQLARGAGLTVIGTAGTPEGLDLVRANGAHHALLGHGEGIAADVLRITGGAGAEVVVEMRADLNLALDLTLVARRGRIVVVGSRGTLPVDPRQIMMREAMILGLFLFAAPPAEISAAHAAVRAALESCVTRPVVGREFPLDQAAEAHRLVLQSGAHGKIVLIP
jgi:NADPH2:quinone reductase